MYFEVLKIYIKNIPTFYGEQTGSLRTTIVSIIEYQ
jgi:hypothetical protein